MGAPGVVLVSCPINNLLATPRLFAPGGVAPPRHSTHYDSSARLARHENPRADRASYLWDRTLESSTHRHAVGTPIQLDRNGRIRGARRHGGFQLVKRLDPMAI